MKINKAIITAAGYGSRFLPISSAIQKEMLPILNRPLIDYVVEDCIKADIKEIIFVVSEHNRQIVDYYQDQPHMQRYLEKFGKEELKDKLPQFHQQVKFQFVNQADHDQYGTAVPVKLCHDLVKDEDAFLVLMGDDFVYTPNGSSEVTRMIKLFTKSEAQGLITCIQRPREDLHKYGIAEITPENGYRFLTNLVEKPTTGTAPSDLANISKYIFTPDILPIIANQQLDSQLGELLITDSVLQLAKEKRVVVYTPQGIYLDGGYLLGWLKANLTVAKNDPQLYQQLKEFIKQEF